MTFDCLVTWPLEPGQGDLIAPILRPALAHACTLPAVHVHVPAQFVPTVVINRTAPLPPALMTAHRCHCGSYLPVRDVEVTS